MAKALRAYHSREGVSAGRGGCWPYCITVRKQRAMKAFSPFLLCILSSAQHPGWCYPHSGGVILTKGTSSRHSFIGMLRGLSPRWLSDLSISINHHTVLDRIFPFLQSQLRHVTCIYFLLCICFTSFSGFASTLAWSHCCHLNIFNCTFLITFHDSLAINDLFN